MIYFNAIALMLNASAATWIATAGRDLPRFWLYMALIALVSISRFLSISRCMERRIERAEFRGRMEVLEKWNASDQKAGAT